LNFNFILVGVFASTKFHFYSQLRNLGNVLPAVVSCQNDAPSQDTSGRKIWHSPPTTCDCAYLLGGRQKSSMNHTCPATKIWIFWGRQPPTSPKQVSIRLSIMKAVAETTQQWRIFSWRGATLVQGRQFGGGWGKRGKIGGGGGDLDLPVP